MRLPKQDAGVNRDVISTQHSKAFANPNIQAARISNPQAFYDYVQCILDVGGFGISFLQVVDMCECLHLEGKSPDECSSRKHLRFPSSVRL